MRKKAESEREAVVLQLWTTLRAECTRLRELVVEQARVERVFLGDDSDKVTYVLQTMICDEVAYLVVAAKDASPEQVGMLLLMSLQPGRECQDLCERWFDLIGSDGTTPDVARGAWFDKLTTPAKLRSSPPLRLTRLLYCM